MKRDFIETFRINELGSLPPYDKRSQEEYIMIGHINGRYGILNSDETEFLAFEYDNITFCGFGLLQTIAMGKSGLVHIRKNEEGKYYIVKEIPCEYDIIDGKSEGVVLLKKYGLYNEFFDGCSVRAYLANPEILTEEYAGAYIVSSEYQRGLISFQRNGINYIISSETGNTVIENKNGFTIGGYETDKATVLQQMHNGCSKLVYIGNDKISEYNFDGNGAYALAVSDEDGRLQSAGFIVESSSGFILLDNELSLLSKDEFPRLSICNNITGYDCNNKPFSFTVGMQTLDITDFI